MDELFNYYKTKVNIILCVNKWKLSGDDIEKLALKFQKRIDEEKKRNDK